MSYPWHAGRALDGDVPTSRLFQAWCGDALELPGADPAQRGATAALAAVDAWPEPATPAPFFAAPGHGAWAAEAGADEPPDDAARAALARNLALLSGGRAAVVVTGQQPGFLGGPLLTLLKAATAVALARRRTAAGRPTVPVFWCGDDDEDVAEALAPVGWDPAADALVRADGRAVVRSGLRRQGMLGPGPARRWCAGAANWLGELARGGAPAGELARLWQRAMAENWTWSRLNVRALLTVLRGQGLVVVRGNDPRLHAAAAPLYASLVPRRDELRDMVRARTAALLAAGWHAQLGERSLARPLYTAAGGERRPLDDGPVGAPGDLRPGVMLRSLVQDWLLRPCAVVVGPAETAYLRQLDPLYAALGVPRSPLVPRLFGWLAPASLDLALIVRHETGTAPGTAQLSRLAAGAADRARRDLAELLQRELGLPADRAQALAAGRARRWRKGVGAMLRHESRRAAQAAQPRRPQWVFPDGQRQERHLAVVAAAALWGPTLTTTLLDAADDHLRQGAQGLWREYLVEVPEPAPPARNGR